MHSAVTMHPNEIHRARRAVILRDRPEIKTLMGPAPILAGITLALVAAQLGVAAALVGRPWWWAVLLALGLGAFIAHYLNVIIHECSHNLVLRGAGANKAVAILANLPALAPSAQAFRHYHLLHHRFLGEPGMDADVSMPWEVRLVGHARWRKLLWLLTLPVVYSVIHPAQVARRLPLDRWLAANIVVVLGVAVAVAFWLGGTPFLYLACSTYLAVGPHPTGAHILQEHIIFEGDYETASYYGPINAISGNHGYHVEHHDFANVPGLRLGRLRAMAAEHYAGRFAHHSRLRSLWQFVTDRRIGLDSRHTVVPRSGLAKSGPATSATAGA